MYVLTAVGTESNEQSQFSKASDAYQRFCALRLSGNFKEVTVRNAGGVVLFSHNGSCRMTQSVLAACHPKSDNTFGNPILERRPV